MGSMELVVGFASPACAQATQRGRRTRTRRAVGIPFSVSDFQILRQVAQQGYYEVTEWEYYERRDPTQPTRTVETSKPAIRLYDAKILRGPLRNARVMLKEFLEPAYRIGIREAEVYERLMGMGGEYRDAPVAELLGSFTGDSSFKAPGFEKQWERSFPKSGSPPVPGSPWLVFAWEGNLTAAGFASYPQTPVFTDRLFPKNRYQRRKKYIRKLMLTSLRSVSFLHGLGFVHRSLGPASLAVNTLDEQSVNLLDVKIRDFGFGSTVSSIDDKEMKKARDNGAISPNEVSRYFFAEDIYALGYAFMEVIFGTLSTTGPGPQTNQEAIKRLFEDVYGRRVSDLREYFAADEAYAEAVGFLDEDDFAGWNLLSLMLSSLQDKNRQSAPRTEELVTSAFLTK